MRGVIFARGIEKCLVVCGVIFATSIAKRLVCGVIFAMGIA